MIDTVRSVLPNLWRSMNDPRVSRRISELYPNQGCLPLARLFVEPDVFHAPAVEDAIDHDRPPLDVGLPTRRSAVVKDDRPGAIFGQLPLNFPDQLLALLGVRLNGLPLDQFVDLGTAIAVVVQLPTAPVR